MSSKAEEVVYECDDLLVKAYDDSVKLAREELARRIANSTNSSQQQQKSDNDGAASDGSQSPGLPTAGQHLQKPSKKTWKVGDFARATYQDGIDYEASIISINALEGTCVLRYIGYGNEEVLPLSDLVPSWGKRARRAQLLLAKGEEIEKSDEATAIDNCDLRPTPDQRKKSKGEKKSHHKSAMADFGGFAVPPPPPMPPMFAAGNHKTEDSEHLSAMLMSWYMSGYYTGVYQGLQMAKKTTKKPKSK